MKNKILFVLMSVLLAVRVDATEKQYQTFEETASIVEQAYLSGKSGGKLKEIVEDVSTIPYLRLVQNPDGSRSCHVSQSMIDLLNNISHARAVGKGDATFMARYAATMARENPGGEIVSLVDFSAEEHWNEELVNEQRSNFNQMIGLLTGLEIARCKKSAPSTTTAPVEFRNMNDWEKWLSDAAGIALDNGFGTEGFIGLVECIDSMKERPIWTLYFCPLEAGSAKVKKRLLSRERAFFSGKLE